MPMETKSYWTQGLCVYSGDSGPYYRRINCTQLRLARTPVPALSTARKILAMFGFRRFLSVWRTSPNAFEDSTTLGHDMRRFSTSLFVCVVSAIAGAIVATVWWHIPSPIPAVAAAEPQRASDPSGGMPAAPNLVHRIERPTPASPQFAVQPAQALRRRSTSSLPKSA